METVVSASAKQRKVNIAVILNDDRLLAAALFLVALFPRLLALSQFITGDEPRWVVRSMAFLTGLLTADWALTLQTGHPGVTTMWTGSLGLALDYLINHQAAESLLAFAQSLPPNYQRIDPTVLPWMRLPTVALSALSIVALFWFLRPLNRAVALVAALLLALHPLHLAYSQLLHHDALVSIFLSLSILMFLTALRRPSWKMVILSGVMGGLAILSKSTAYALLPFVGVVLLLELLARQQTLKWAVPVGLIWGSAALATVVALWPATWVAPLEVFQTVFGWVDQSANVDEVSNTLIPTFSGRVPDLGLLFYPTNWLVRTTPLMMLGLLFFIFWWRKTAPNNPARWWTNRLLLWIGLFSLMLTLGDKRDGRYLLPIYFALCALAAFGLITIYQLLKTKRAFDFFVGPIRANLYQVMFAALLLGFSVTYYPYYLSYFNPLVGGPWLAPGLVKVGLGNGMEQAAAWLNHQPNAQHLRVATDLEQTFAPYFAGQAVSPDANRPFSADYVLNYIRVIQNGVPFDEYWDYYQARPPDFELRVSGIDYLWLHHEPPLVNLGRIPVGDALILRAYTVDRPLAIPGKPFVVTLIWRTDSPPGLQAQVQLRDEAGKIWVTSDAAPVIDPQGPSAVEGHYPLNLPAAMPRGRYTLWVSTENIEDWVEVTPVPVGRISPTEAVAVPFEANFSNQIALRGFGVSNPTPASGQSVTLTLHWQALNDIPVSYTTFVHVVDSKGGVVAQSDVLPGRGQWLTTGWQPQEWITDQLSLSLPADLPPGQYQVWVGWYHVPTGQRLPLIEDSGGQNVVELGALQVQ